MRKRIQFFMGASGYRGWQTKARAPAGQQSGNNQEGTSTRMSTRQTESLRHVQRAKLQWQAKAFSLDVLPDLSRGLRQVDACEVVLVEGRGLGIARPGQPPLGVSDFHAVCHSGV